MRVTDAPFAHNSEATVSQALQHLIPQVPRKRRGRPPGAKSLVVRDQRSLGIHHFSFIRSSLLGLDLRESFERYLEWSETTSDLRHIEHRRQELLKQIIEAARILDANLPAAEKITDLVTLLRSDAPVPSAVKLPTLEQWAEAEGMDPDAYSEAELVAEYKAAFGLDNIDAQDAAESLADPAMARVRALNHLETLLAVSPRDTDRLDLWFARPVVIRLRNVGVTTLADLANFINLYGFRWHNRIQGFGAQRAARVLAWMRSLQENLNLAISDAVDEPRSVKALRRSLVAGPGALPVQGNGQYAPSVPGAFSNEMYGAAGAFRTHMANTLGAENDQQAIEAWLSRYNEKPATLRSYRKEVERFMLWSTSVQRKPISSITAPDCQAFRNFLQNVPPNWINPVPVKRSDPAWRAFRGQPSSASIKQSLVIIQDK